MNFFVFHCKIVQTGEVFDHRVKYRNSIWASIENSNFTNFRSFKNSRIYCVNYKMPQNVTNRFAVMSYNMKLENFLDLQTDYSSIN